MYDYWLKRGVIFLWVAIVIMGVSLFITREDAVKYEASAKVLVDQPQIVGQPSGSSSPGKIQQMIPTYAQSVMTLYTAEKVAFKLPEYTVEEIQKALSSSAVERTQILAITAKTGDTQMSMDIAQMAARVFVDDIEKQQDDYRVQPQDRFRLQILEPATTIKIKDPHRSRTAFLAGLAGIIVAAGGILVYENGRRA